MSPQAVRNWAAAGAGPGQRAVCGWKRPAQATQRRSSIDLDMALAWLAVTATCGVAAGTAGGTHWALLPLGACGAIEGPTVVRWMRGR